jgi:hypothetical protein
MRGKGEEGDWRELVGRMEVEKKEGLRRNSRGNFARKEKMKGRGRER